MEIALREPKMSFSLPSFKISIRTKKFNRTIIFEKLGLKDDP